MSRLNSLRKKPVRCHSERSEESLLIHNKNLSGILRAKFALRMTVCRFFPQTLKRDPQSAFMRWLGAADMLYEIVDFARRQRRSCSSSRSDRDEGFLLVARKIPASEDAEIGR